MIDRKAHHDFLEMMIQSGVCGGCVRSYPKRNDVSLVRCQSRIPRDPIPGRPPAPSGSAPTGTNHLLSVAQSEC